MNFIKSLYNSCKTMTQKEAREFYDSQPHTTAELIQRSMVTSADVEAVYSEISRIHAEGGKITDAGYIAQKFGFSLDKTRAIFKEIARQKKTLNGKRISWNSV